MLISRRHFGIGLVCALPGMNSHAGLVDVVAAAKPAVVAIGTFNATASPRFTFRGTGFVVGDGTQVVTNAHVLPESADNTFGTQLSVSLPRGGGIIESRIATLIRVDRAHDLALLRFEGSKLPVLSLGAADAVAEGLAVAFMGFPIGGVLGFSTVTHRGIISAVTRIVLPQANASRLNERTVAQMRDGTFDIYQLDGTAYPGNSGGPLLDAESGQVLGVINMVLVKGSRESALSNPTGITYAIPVRYARELLSGP